MATKVPFLAILLTLAFLGGFELALSYDRPSARESIFTSLSKSLDSTSPQQVHISVVGRDKMKISWITDDSTQSTVKYGTSPGAYQFSANGSTNKYHYLLYKSGEIHDVVIGPLKPNTIYYYRCGLDSSPEFSFKTPPGQFPIRFAIIGDLGQTEWTSSTLQHIAKSNYDMLLLPGDLAYSYTNQLLWDSFGRLVEPLARQRPWMVTQGNHEIEKVHLIHSQPFTSYNARWSMPYEQSGSDSNLYYSLEVVGVHVIMLGSYTNFDSSLPQYKWLALDLKKVDRKKTPWLVVLVHAPWYNSNTAHQGEKECVEMKAAMEELLYDARVDLVFAGHVHAYERFTRVYKEEANNCGPAYITIGDGGNVEGLAKKYKDSQPAISLFREASFGHGELEVVNATHAQWTWHRNDEDEVVVADTVWLRSLTLDPTCIVS